MFVIHADTWNAADPQKIIDLIPADLRPYTVLLISLSISHKGATNNQCNWNQVANGIETARSWIKTAAANGVWAMVQPSSGGFSHFPDYPNGTDLESTVYGEFFRDYPTSSASTMPSSSGDSTKPARSRQRSAGNIGPTCSS